MKSLFAAFRKHVPFKVREKNLKFFAITQKAFIFGLLTHACSIGVFWWLDVREIAVFNIIISVPAFLSAIYANRLGRHSLAFAVAFFELFTHQIFAIYFLGWDFGFQYWLVYLAALCFFNPKWSNVMHFILLALISSGYIVAFLFFQQGVYSLPPQVLTIAYLVNGVIAFVVIALLINYYSRTAFRAERQLKEEKEITEKQNVQLRQQHESLVIEQDRTHKMLTKIESLFGQQVSQEVAQELIKNEREIDSKIYDVTIMFLDIRDFTKFADSREPAEVAKFQNTVFSELIEIVKEHKGVVSQILGDGILAVFGAPVVDKKHVQHGVSSGYAMLDKIKELSECGDIPKIKIGIGLNAGKVVAGNVGNETRKFYSLTGTTVIIASRIEQLNKQFDSQFLVSENVYSVMKNKINTVEELGKMALKGIDKKISVYKLA